MRIYKNIQKITTCLAIACIFLVPFISSTPGHAASRVVKVGIYDNPPKLFLDKNGVAQGLYPDIVNAIAAKEGWTVQYVNGTFDEGLSRLRSGKIDIMEDVAISPERQKIYDFNNETILISWGQVYTRKGVTVNSMLDLNGKRMAILESGIHYTGPGGMKAQAEAFKININFINVNEYADVFKLLQENKADVGVVTRTFGIYEAEKYNVQPTAIIFNPVELRFAFTKGSAKNADLIKEIDTTLQEMKADPGSAYNKSIDKYIGTSVLGKINVVPLWAKILLFTLTPTLILILIIFLVQRRFQKSLRNALDSKSKELARSEQTYKTLFDSAKDAIIIGSAEGFIDCNKAALELFKAQSVTDFVAKGLADLAPSNQPGGKDSKVVTNERIEQTFAQGSQHFEWESQRFDGSRFDADVLLSKTRVKGRDVVQATVRDISDQKRAERDMAILDELRSQFIRIISHQLRTPLNVTRWNLEILLKGDLGLLTENQKDFLRSTYKTEVDIISKIGDLLTIVDIEENRVTADKALVSLDELFTSAVEKWNKIFKTKNIDFVGALSPELIPSIPADASKIMSTYDHLLQNAFDYTPEGGKVIAKLSRVNANIRFELTDSGIGVPEAEKEKVFLKFSRCTNATGLVPDRTGISLAICKYFIENLHGGKIGFESKEDAGSTFWFELPANPLIGESHA